MKKLRLSSIIIYGTIFCLVCLFAFRALAYFVIIPWDNKDDPHYQFVAHEGGGIDGYTYTSSKEAVDLAIVKGFRLIELDLIETSDGNLVGAHDWVQFKQITGQQTVNEVPMSQTAACNLKIHTKYSVLCTNDIRSLLSSNPDLNLVTDKTNNFALINSLGAQNRIFVEVFGGKNYIKSIFYGIKRPLYSLSIGKLGEFGAIFRILLLNPKYVAINTLIVNEHEGLIEWIHQRGIKIFIFTSNDTKFIQSVQKRYDATVYTDFLNPLTGTCDVPNCKTD